MTEESRLQLEPHEAPDEQDALTPDELLDLDTAEDEASPISYMGTDFDVEGLVRRLNRQDIAIPSFGHGDIAIDVSGFQRGFVWSRNQMDRFIESLLLGYPIPGIMLVQQQDQRYLVLDGQQRLRTLSAFYAGIHEGREFALKNVAAQFRGLTYATLPADLRRQLDNTFIQATIVRTDGTPGSRESVYQVFERLNSGGTQLTPHEIRIALYAGPLIDFTDSLNQNENWRTLYGPRSPRLRDQELVLRIVAFYVGGIENYRPPLKTHLNSFADKYRNLSGMDTDLISERFDRAAELLLESQGRASVRYQSRQVNAALTEALFTGLMIRLNKGEPSKRTVNGWISKLLSDVDFVSAISKSTASEDNVRTRYQKAVQLLNKGSK